MAAQMSLAAYQEVESLAQFKQLIQKNLDAEIYEGWLDHLEIYTTEKEIVFANIGHLLFKEDIERNHGLLFHDLAEQCFSPVPQKMTFMVGRPKLKQPPPVSQIGKSKFHKTIASVNRCVKENLGGIFLIFWQVS